MRGGTPSVRIQFSERTGYRGGVTVKVKTDPCRDCPLATDKKKRRRGVATAKQRKNQSLLIKTEEKKLFLGLSAELPYELPELLDSVLFEAESEVQDIDASYLTLLVAIGAQFSVCLG